MLSMALVNLHAICMVGSTTLTLFHLVASRWSMFQLSNDAIILETVKIVSISLQLHTVGIVYKYCNTCTVCDCYYNLVH